MAFDALTFSGSLATAPLSGSAGVPFISTPVSETLNLAAKIAGEYTLNADAPQAVNFGNVNPANVIYLKVVSGPPVRARLTWSNSNFGGLQATQAVEVDGFFFQIDRTTGITALDLTRTPGQISVVETFLGQSA